ncbi:MAG: glycine cleavage system aminomethyltransferase GcvT [Ilumatobacteraceae bacterium]
MNGHRVSPLDEVHRELGAKMVPFGGWEMPLSYPTGTIAEHMACRNDAAVFDVSHLGTVRVEGAGAFDVLQREFTNDLRKVAPGRAQYTHACNDRGGVTDDIIVWWLSEECFDVMPNASNTERVRSVVGGTDTTTQRAILAVQGPHARHRLATVSQGAANVKRFRVETVDVLGVPCVVAGTGYTGEDGVEIAVPVDHAPSVARALIAAGVTMAGLGARDTLRLEAGLPLHGHELSADISPLEANLGWVIGWDKDDFRGKSALANERAVGVRRKLCGIRTTGRRPPRDGARVMVDGVDSGVVTSGNFSPVLGAGIAFALLTPEATQVGRSVVVKVRDSELPGTVVATPFVTAPK